MNVCYLKFNVFDYLTKEELFALLVCFFVGLILLIIFLSVICSQKKKLHNNLNKINCTRVYSVNLELSEVKYFDIFSPSKSKSITLDDFVKIVEKKERVYFKNWLNDIADKSVFVQDYFICNNEKEKATLLFKVIKINGLVLHIESILFENLSKSLITRNLSKNFLDEEAIVEYYDLLKKRKKKNIAIYFISTFDDLQYDNYNQINHFETLLRLINRIAPNLKHTHYFYFVNNQKLCLINFKPKNDKEVAKLASKLSFYMDKIIACNSKYKSLDYRLCVLKEFNYKTFNLRVRIHNADDFCLYAKNRDESEKLVYFEKHTNFNKSNHSIIVDEINRILKSNAFKVLYKPFADIKTGKTRGYIANVVIKSNIISNIDKFEVETYNQGLEIDYLTQIIDKSLKVFQDTKNKKKNRILLIPIYFPILLSIEKCLANKDLGSNQIVFMIDSKTIRYIDNKMDNVKDILEKNSKSKVKLALKISGVNDYISPELMDYFAYITCSQSLIAKIKTDTYSRVIMSDYILQNKKQEYIALGIDTWSGTELLAMLGYNYLSGSIIGTSQETLEDINKKVSQIISNFNE